VVPADGAAVAPSRRLRDANRTRRLLLTVASGRFARDGYPATTVRDIADEAGVNVALISRYFTSKEGLFEACLCAAASEVRRDSDNTPLEEIAAAMARRMAGSAGDERLPEPLLLLLRSTGDERVDEIRRGFLLAITEKVATVAAGGSLPAEGDPALLRAQILLAATLGVTLLRSSLNVQPLAGATEQDLVGPLSDLVNALLAPKGA
jgi:AcrR family transcriptional regulator